MLTDTLLDLACGGAEGDIDYSGVDPGAAPSVTPDADSFHPGQAFEPPPTTETPPASPPATPGHSGYDESAAWQPHTSPDTPDTPAAPPAATPDRDASFDPGQAFEGDKGTFELSPPGTGMRSEVSIERERGLGDRHWQADDFALKYLQDRNFGAQKDLADGLLDKVRSSTHLPPDKQQLLTDSERDALELLRRDTQTRGGFDVSAYMKAKCGDAYTTDRTGLRMHTDDESGLYGTKTFGLERSLDLKVGKATLYTEQTFRDDGTSSERSGLKLEMDRGLLVAGVDLNDRSSKLYAKLEAKVGMPNGCSIAYGGQFSVDLPTGNGDARGVAGQALHGDAKLREWNAGARR